MSAALYWLSASVLTITSAPSLRAASTPAWNAWARPLLLVRRTTCSTPCARATSTVLSVEPSSITSHSTASKPANAPREVGKRRGQRLLLVQAGDLDDEFHGRGIAYTGGAHYRARAGGLPWLLPRLPGISTSADVESATVQRRASGYAGLATRVRALPADAIALWAFVALTILAIVGFFVRVTYPNYDSYYSLVWGREAANGQLPSFEAFRAPTEHPLAVAFGAVLSLFGQHADRLFVLLTLLSFVALAAGTYRLGRLCFTPFVGAVATFLILTRFDFPSLAVRGYIDIPFMATVVWAGALEAARPRRGRARVPAARGGRSDATGGMAPVRALLPLDELARLHACPGRLRAARGDRTRSAGWRPTSSSPATRCSRSPRPRTSPPRCERTKSGSGVLAALPSDLRITVKTPVFFAGLAGIVIALWRYPARSVIPFVLFCAGTFTFVATGLVGLSVIVRYLLVPGVMMSLFAAVAVGGFTMLPRGSRRAAALGKWARASRWCWGSPGRRFTHRASCGSTTSSCSGASRARACMRCSRRRRSRRAFGAGLCRSRPTG